MPERERSPNLPELPNPWPRTDYVPVGDDTAALELDAIESAMPAEDSVIPQETTVPIMPGDRTPPQERQRVTLTGRVGSPPIFRQSLRTKQTIAKFPLGVHPTPDTTDWKTVLAFGQRAEQLRGTLKKGAQVEVIGYVHTREMRGRDGQVRIVEEIYAVAVRR